VTSVSAAAAINTALHRAASVYNTHQTDYFWC